MTTKQAQDFLDKELFVNRNIVTFRSLSRELGIHVNDAKNELQRYYDGARDTDARAVPTYLVSGEVPALKVNSHAGTQQSDCAMDLDLEFEEHREEMDVVYQSKVLLVDALILNEVKSQFSRLHSVHIYSLSPSRFGDAGLVCTPIFKIHEADAKGGPGFFSIVGKITGSHVKLRTGATYKNTASSSKTTLDAPVKTTPKTLPSVKTEQQVTKDKTLFSDKKEQASTTPLARTESKDRPKASGKLDWSKAKTKEKEPVMEKTKEDKTSKPDPKSTVATNDSSSNKNSRPEPTKLAASKLTSSSVVSSDVQKQGLKRKPRIDTDQESGSELLSTSVKSNNAGGPSLKKGVVYSDDDDSESQVRMLGRRRPQKKSTMTSDSEMSLRAMMDIDDDQVNRVSRVCKTRPQREEEEESSEPEKEVSMPPATSEGEGEESDDIPIIPKKRKSRRVIPVGRNGLRKRRVVKSRTTTDAKGYMQTEDFSSYESVEEEEVQTKSKGKRRATKKALEPKVEEPPRKAKVVVKEESIREPKAKSAPKLRGGASKRGGILNFFGPERGKK